MRRDSFQAIARRINAHTERGDYEVALKACDSYEAALDAYDLEEQMYNQHCCKINLFRGFIYLFTRRVDEARSAFEKAIQGNDHFLLSLIAYQGLFGNAYAAGLKDEALQHISLFLGAEPEDIWALLRRGLLLREICEDEETPNHQYLEIAICDLRSAYALIRAVKDERVYRLKVYRDISDELESSCRDSQKMYALMQINPILGAPTVDMGQNAVDVHDLFYDFSRPTFEYTPSVSAGPSHLIIGHLLASSLLIKEEDGWVEAVDILDEIEPLAQQYYNTDSFAEILALASLTNLYIYTICEDVKYLDTAKSKLVDLLMLSQTHTLTQETLKLIEDLETYIDNLTTHPNLT